MNRRDLLRSLGAAGVLAFAGCTADAGDAGDRDDTTTHTPDGDDEPDDSFERLDRGADPVESFVVGDREGVPFPDDNGPHHLHVYNDADRARTMTLSLRRDGETALDRTVSVPGGRRVDVTLNEPAAYRLAIDLDGEGSVTGAPVDVKRSRFDCNGSWTAAAVGPEGTVETRTMSTLVACPDPAVADAAVEHEDGSCGDTDRADVAFADEQVRVSGSHRTPTPCHALTLSAAEMRGDEAEGQTLVVTVGTTDRQGACVECVGTIPYEATVELEHGYPSTVRVVHAGPSGERVVAERDR